MEGCDSGGPTPTLMSEASTTAVLDEEKDSCGELPLGAGTGSTTSPALINRRCSEFYPPPTTRPGMPGGAPRQGRRDRRLSDPGRLEVPLLRISLHGDPSNGDRGWHPGVRLSDPRLDAIRSLLSSGPDEVGEALPTAVPAPSSPPLVHRHAGPPRSRSPTDVAGGSSKSRQTRWDSRRLSLPNPQPLSSPPLWARRASGSSGGGGAGTTWLPAEMGEAMGAVSGSPGGAEFPTGSPPPRPSPLTSMDHSAAAIALRRRRSVSLDQSSRLEAISEENAAAALKARKSEQLQQTD